jgi:hypothetical protein
MNKSTLETAEHLQSVKNYCESEIRRLEDYKTISIQKPSYACDKRLIIDPIIYFRADQSFTLPPEILKRMELLVDDLIKLYKATSLDAESKFKAL